MTPEQSQEATDERREDIAIVGMAGRFPGAGNVFEFWENLRDGVESIRTLTGDELRAAGVTEATLQSADYVAAGALLEDADCFDAPFFGLTKREAEIMDPQHRVFLESAWSAFEHAGYDPDTYEGVIGVFGGVAPNTYLQNVLLTRPDIVRVTGRYPLLIGSEREYAVTRTAFKLGLTGPAISVNTACSTSGVALHLACQSVLSGECDMALVGGARVKAPLTSGYVYEQDGILSADGHCRAFDAEATGTVVGSGVAMVVIKRLSDALRDGDTVHAVVLGTAVNNDGAMKIGYTAPSIEGQAAVITEALDMADIDAATISYVEAHGTGTFLGDPIEIAALTQAFGTGAGNHCAIGSVKSNIGHLDAGAGMAGIIKTVLALQARQLPPSLNFENPNPQIDFASSPFVVNAALSEWTSPGAPRRAGVSSFGLGGTNSHVIIEEAPPQPAEPSSRRHQLLVLSARSEGALDEATSNLAAHLANHRELDIADVAYTLQVGRRHFPHRRFVVTPSLEDAITALDERDPRHVPTAEFPGGDRKVVFMFPGGGAQYIGMGRDLWDSEPVFRQAIEDCAAAINPRIGTDLMVLLYPEDGSGTGGEPLERPATALPALFAVEYALAKLLISRGVEPDMMIGHSLGEYTAACLSGVFSLEDALALVALRGELFETLPEGAMLSVPLPEDEVRALIGPQYSIAVVNKPGLCIVAGAVDDIDRLAETLAARDVDSSKLHISVAAHSHLVEPILDDFVAFARTIKFSPPQIPFASNTSGTWITPEAATDPEHWGRHLRNTVRFVDGLAAVLDGPDRVLVEVGPGQALSGFARQHPARADGQVAVACMRHPTESTPDDAFLLKSLGRLWQSGVAVELDELHAGDRRRRVPLPGYVFERKRYWIETGSTTANGAITATVDPIETPVASTTRTSEEENAAVSTQPAADRKSRILTKIQSIFHELSGLEPHELDPYATFLELGFDSLFMTQATSAVGSSFGVRVSFRQLFEEAPTLDALAVHLNERLPVEAFAAPAAPPQLAAPGATPSRSVPAGGVEQLITQQLEIMRQQLAALRGEVGIPAAAPEPVAEPVTREEALPPSAAEPRPTGPWRPIARQREELSARQRADVAGLVDRLTAHSPGSKQLTQENRATLADPRTVAGFRLPWKEIVYPVVVDRSAGSRVWDVDGNEYLDVAMGFGVNLFGHSPQFVIDAVGEQLTRGIEIGPQTPLAGEVAGLISELTGHERVAFCNTGSEAVLAALRLARTVTGRSKVVTFANDYHGLFDEVLARGIKVGSERRSVPIAPGIPAHMAQDLVILDYDDPESLEIIADLAPELAAVLIEPVQSRHPDLQPRQFLQDLRRIATAAGVPLIFDEMITGFRSHPGGVQSLFDVRADIATYGKVIGGGFPIGVVAGSRQYMDALDGGTWAYGDDSIPEADVTWFAGTFVRHPVALAASRAALLHMKEQGPTLQEELTARTAAFVSELNTFLHDRSLPVHIETFASLFLPRFKSGQQYASLFYFHLRDQGIHITEGRAAFLSTAHSDADLEQLSDAFKAAFDQMADAGFLTSEEAASALPSGEAVSTGGPLEAPLTEGQLEIWLATQLGDDANCAYNLANTLELDGELDLDTLVDSIQALVDRHEALRTTVDRSGEHQRIDPSLRVEVPIVDLSSLAAADQEEQFAALHVAAVETPFDLEAGPLARFSVVRFAADRHLLLFTVHHIVCDGWSSGVLFADLAEIYAAAAQTRLPNLDEPMQLRDYANWEAGYRSGKGWKDDEAFWTASLETPFPVSDFPPDRRRGPTKTYRADREEIRLEPALVAQLRDVSATHGVTLFTELLGAFEVYLHRLSGESEVALGVSIAGQTQFIGRHLVGHCINMLPLRRTVDAAGTFEEHVRSTHGAFLDAFDHQYFSYGSLVRRLDSRRDPARTPLVSIIFNMDSPSPALDFDGAVGHTGSLPRHFENFDIFLNAVPDGDSLVIECTYNTGLYDGLTIRRRLEGFATLLAAIGHDDGSAVAALPVVSASEQQLMAAWNETFADYDTAAALHGLFESRVAADPDSIALIFRGREVSYGELNARANGLAHTLIKTVPGNTLIGVFMDRSVEMVVALYAVLKAGLGYVPLDPEYPEERLRFMIEETAMPVILTQSEFAVRVPGADAAVVVVDASGPVSADLPNPALPFAAAQTAYVMYTSGSTGRPKGVVVSHRAICNQMLWAQEAFQLTPTDRVLQKTPFSFDVSTLELFWPLLNGATLVIAEPGGHRDPEYLVRTIVDHKITTALFVPSMLRMFVDQEGVDDIVSLELVISSGEALPPDLEQRFFEHLTADLHNLYGPTETGVHVTHWQCRRDYDAASIPIGRPVANTTAYILDDSLHHVPIGAVGELHVGGTQLADGYHGRPDLTADRFVIDPFSDSDTERLYKTGDIARFHNDGNIEYLGRRDGQVKIRGNRVELGEIDSIIMENGAIRDAVTIVWDTQPGEERLIAYVAPHDGPLDEAALREFMKGRLPRYMVPSRLVELDELPRTTSGKIDRRALPAPAQPAATALAKPVQPRTPLEEDIAAIWCDVLELEVVGIHDDFFDLGGHSLDAMRANARIREMVDVDMSLGLFFENPTVAGQALTVTEALAAQLGGIDELGSLVADLTAGDPAPTKATD